VASVYEVKGVWLPVPKPVPLYQVVRAALLNAMAYTDGHQRQAGALLGLTERQMTYQLRAYAVPAAGLGRPRKRKTSVPRLGRRPGRMRLHRVK